MPLQRGSANAGAWAGTTAQLGRSMDRCGLEQWVGKATGAHRGGSDPAGGKRAARQHAPGQVRALANTPDMGHL